MQVLEGKAPDLGECRWSRALALGVGVLGHSVSSSRVVQGFPVASGRLCPLRVPLQLRSGSTGGEPKVLEASALGHPGRDMPLTVF